MFRAKIDAQGIYLGAEPVETLQDGDIEVPEDCSLKPGAYLWNAEHGHFDPLPIHQRRAAPDVPTIEEVVHAIIETMETPPEICVKWDKAYTSFVGSIGKVMK